MFLLPPNVRHALLPVPRAAPDYQPKKIVGYFTDYPLTLAALGPWRGGGGVGGGQKENILHGFSEISNHFYDFLGCDACLRVSDRSLGAPSTATTTESRI
jgi:hypothetical protein